MCEHFPLRALTERACDGKLLRRGPTQKRCAGADNTVLTPAGSDCIANAELVDETVIARNIFLVKIPQQPPLLTN